MMGQQLRNPLVWILTAAAGLRLAGLFWGLPASDGWDDDGFAPRNFLTALALTYKHGAYFTYPPLHAIFLALPTLPGLVIALLQAPSLHPADVISEFIKPSYMTFFAVTARLVNLLLSLGIIWCVGAMAQLVAGRRAGLFAAGACALNFGLTYYGQVSNLDVPCLFWAMLALLWVMRAVAEHEPLRFWPAALFTAAAIATKDQAYALFALTLPAFLLLWFACDSWPRAHVRPIVRIALPATIVALFALLLVDGAFTNPAGFARRLAFLTGPASADYAAYSKGWSGLQALLLDMAAWFGTGAALPATLLAVLGAGLIMTHTKDLRIAGLLPALAILSFTVCFNFTALRTDARFLLPQAVLGCVYIGIAASWLTSLSQPGMRLAASAVIALTALASLHVCIAVSAAMLQDPRYDAQSWLQAHIRPGETIETYGQNAYLPHFPAGAAVIRVGTRSLAGRNPLPGVREVRSAFDAPRASRFIVVNDWWMRHYTDPQSELGGHRSPSAVQAALFHDIAARRYFTDLRDDHLPYRLAHRAGPATGFWPQVHIHESLGEAILIYERVP